MKFKVVFQSSLIIVLFILNGCPAVAEGDKSKDIYKAVEGIVIDSKRSNALDKLFDNNTLGSITLTVREDEWNQLLSNVDSRDYRPYVKADMVFIKDNETYTRTNVGLRIRGNSTKRKPEDASVHDVNKPKYQQAHFKIGFTEFCNTKAEEDAQKIAGAIKGLNLKYMVSDSSYVQEIYSYDLFKRFKVWTAPRASYVKLYIKVGSSDLAYFGMYKSIEQINKQFLKGRKDESAFSGGDGNLWKCLYQMSGPADLKNEQLDSRIGVDTKDVTPTYSLKTNEDTGFEAAKTEFKEFLANLNNLTGGEFKTWISNKMDVDLFLRTLAVSVSTGMWDDYWCNFNNYYLYFDPNGKVYFITYDYDNCLGVVHSNLMKKPAEQNLKSWGKTNAVLVTKILAISEYKELYKKYLQILASNDFDLLNPAKSKARIESWYSLIESSCTGYDADWNFEKDKHKDWSLKKSVVGSYSLVGDKNNFFKLKCDAIGGM